MTPSAFRHLATSTVFAALLAALPSWGQAPAATLTGRVFERILTGGAERTLALGHATVLLTREASRDGGSSPRP